MNLHAIVAGAIGAINPQVACTLSLSVGYTVAADFTQVPQYTVYQNLLCQVQELTSRDLRQLDGLNIQGALRSVYLNGQWQGVVRVGARGGDLLTMWDGTVWKVAAVLELWPDWTKLAVILQNGS